MFSLLTKYLVQYGRVCIPHIGTFEIVHQPPQLQMADQLFKAPFFTTRFFRIENVSQHQFNFIAAAGKNELSFFGEQLKRKIKTAPVQWNGFGTLRYVYSEIIFEPDEIELHSLTDVAAQKLMRGNEHHSMLVGDRQMNLQQVTAALNVPVKKTPLYIIIGWIVFTVAVAAIIFLLYSGKFQITSSGLQMKAVANLSSPHNLLS